MQIEVSSSAKPTTSFAERRRHPRTISHTTCLLRARSGVYEYVVRNLSVSGALLIGGPVLGRGMPVQVELHIPLYPDFRVWARVLRRGTMDDGTPFIAIAFAHDSDTTEDHIQSALLSELERSHTHGIIPTDL